MLFLFFANKPPVARAVGDAKETNEQLTLALDVHTVIDFLSSPLLDVRVPYFYEGFGVHLHLG